METTANHEQIRYWNEQGGPRWVKLQQRLDVQIGPLGQAAMQRAEIKPGEHILDVGCGCGQTSLELAERVGQQGQVVGVDISQPMLARARERQRELGLKNLHFLQADAQTYAFERERFDIVFSRFGVMFFIDPVQAFTNLRAALRPSGRLGFVCWQAQEKNEWAQVPLKAALQYVQPPVSAPPGSPGPFAFADPDRVQHMLESAGFKDVTLESNEAQLSMGGATNGEEAADFALEIGVVARLLIEASVGVRAQVARVVRDALILYTNANGVQLGGAVWIVSAQAF